MNDSLPRAARRRRPGREGDDGFAESADSDGRFEVLSATNSLLRVNGLYKLESMVGFCDHRLDKRSGTRLVYLAPSSETRQS
jgi:hypothetical protein